MRGSPGRRVRFPIAALMALIALLAVEMASLRVATDGFVDLTRALTIATLLAATFRARHASGDRAAWWFGFAAVGWAYLILVIDAASRRDPSAWAAFRAPPPVPFFWILIGDVSQAGNNPRWDRLRWNQMEILQSILTLAMASLGGLATWIWARRRGAPYRQEESRSGRLELDDRAE